MVSNNLKKSSIYGLKTSNRWLGIAFVFTAFLFTPVGYADAQQNLWTKLVSDKDRSVLIYMACPPDDGGEECTTHSLECSGYKFTVELGAYEPAQIASVMASLTKDAPSQSTARPRFNLAGINGGVLLDFPTITTEYYDLDGLWHLRLSAWDASSLFEALSSSSVSGASLKFASDEFELSPEPDNGKSLLSFKSACIALMSN